MDFPMTWLAIIAILLMTLGGCVGYWLCQRKYALSLTYIDEAFSVMGKEREQIAVLLGMSEYNHEKVVEKIRDYLGVVQ